MLATVDPNDLTLRRRVEGRDFQEDATRPTQLEHASYQAETARAQQLVGVVGIHNVYAAYFLGKVELIGKK